VDST
jgi:hypothetical protein